MTAKRRLVPPAEVEAHITLLRKLGVQIGSVDIRADGVTISPLAPTPENDFDQWLQKDKSRDRPSRHS